MIDKGLALALFVSAFINFMQYYHCEDLKNKLSNYESEIAQLHKDNLAQIQQYESAHEIAVDQMRHVQDETQGFLRTKVPKDCDSSMKWLIQEARNL